MTVLHSEVHVRQAFTPREKMDADDLGKITIDSHHLADYRLNKCRSNEGSNFNGRVHKILSGASETRFDFILRKGDRFFNCQIGPDSNDSAFAVARGLTVESLVRVTGLPDLDANDCGQMGDDRLTDIKVSSIELLSQAKANLPETPQLHGAPGETLPSPSDRASLIDKRLDNRLLDARVPATAAIFKLFSGVQQLAVEFLAAQDFYHIPTPAFVTYEFPGEEDDHFYVPFFDRKAMLAPTGEVHLGMALAADLERVYDIHTVFRREPKSDGRHLTEFTMLELVFALENDWTEILELADSLLVFLLSSLQEREKYKKHTLAAQRLYTRAGDFKLGLDKHGELPRVTFREAKGFLRNILGREAHDGEDLTREEEALLGELLSSSNTPLGTPTDVFIVTHFPTTVRPCNVHPSKEDATTTYSFDILLRGQEIVTACQLLHSYQDVRTAFQSREHPIDPDSPGWQPYTTAHEIGMPPWGGFGLGLNRLVQGFLGLDDIRETVLFPRDACRLAP